MPLGHAYGQSWTGLDWCAIVCLGEQPQALTSGYITSLLSLRTTKKRGFTIGTKSPAKAHFTSEIGFPA